MFEVVSFFFNDVFDILKSFMSLELQLFFFFKSLNDAIGLCL